MFILNIFSIALQKIYYIIKKTDFTLKVVINFAMVNLEKKQFQHH